MKSSVHKLVKIGTLARKYQVLPSTIHFYTSQGLLPEDARSPGGYRLYSEEKAVRRLDYIRQLQERKRLSIAEIKKLIKKT